MYYYLILIKHVLSLLYMDLKRKSTELQEKFWIFVLFQQTHKIPYITIWINVEREKKLLAAYSKRLLLYLCEYVCVKNGWMNEKDQTTTTKKPKGILSSCWNVCIFSIHSEKEMCLREKWVGL